MSYFRVPLGRLGREGMVGVQGDLRAERGALPLEHAPQPTGIRGGGTAQPKVPDLQGNQMR